jgi:hypothetical protein
MPKMSEEKPPDLRTPEGRFRWFAIAAFGGLPQFILKNELNASQIYRVAKGGSVPKLDYCAMIAEKGLNIHWWGTGEGQWYAPNDSGEKLAERIGREAPLQTRQPGATRVTAVVPLESVNEIVVSGKRAKAKAASSKSGRKGTVA